MKIAGVSSTIVSGHRRTSARCLVFAIATAGYSAAGLAQAAGHPAGRFHQVYVTSPAGAVSMNVEVEEGNLRIAYARDGEVSFSLTVQTPPFVHVDEEDLASSLLIEQKGNHFVVHQANGQAFASRYPPEQFKVTYQIDVPYGTEINSTVGHGKQLITGISGPVRAQSQRGDIKASYISEDVFAHAAAGDLDLEVIGGRVEGSSERGSLTCLRADKSVRFETGDGDISLTSVGTSEAMVKRGRGRIEISGARGAVVASTMEGALHIKAVPYEDWRLRSASGDIRGDLPLGAAFEIDTTAAADNLLISREDMTQTPTIDSQRIWKANGGGKHIEIQSEGGNVIVR